MIKLDRIVWDIDVLVMWLSLSYQLCVLGKLAYMRMCGSLAQRKQCVGQVGTERVNGPPMYTTSGSMVQGSCSFESLEKLWNIRRTFSRSGKRMEKKDLAY